MIQEIQDIVKQVAIENGLTVADILIHNNSQVLVDIRREVVARCRAKGYSLPEIGRGLNRHHTTILHLSKGRRRGSSVKATARTLLIEASEPSKMLMRITRKGYERF